MVAVQIIKLPIMRSLPVPCYRISLKPEYYLNTLLSTPAVYVPCYRLALKPKRIPQHSALNICSLYSSLNVRYRVSYACKTHKIIVLYILIFIMLDSRRNICNAGKNSSTHFLLSVCSQFLRKCNLYLLAFFQII